MAIKERKSKVVPSFRKAHFILIALSILSLIASVYLSYTHYKVYTDLSYTSFCALTQSVNCDTVAQSVFSILGPLPLSVWGIIVFLPITVFLLISLKNDNTQNGFWSFVLFFYILSSIYSIFLAYISVCLIKSICIFCFLIYITLWISLFVVIIAFKRYKLNLWRQIILDFQHLVKNKYLNKVLLCYSLIIVCVALLYPKYWIIGYASQLSNYSLDSGITESGDPWIGAKNPQITIIEYTDYQCFACRKTHYALRHILEKYPEKIQLIHRHFPLSSSCNPIAINQIHNKSCFLAQVAICAQYQGSFWDVHDALFMHNQLYSKKEINIKKILSSTNVDYSKIASCFNSIQCKKKLMEDIKQGILHKVEATPSFFVHDRLYKGTLPIKRLVEELKNNKNAER